MKNIVKIRSDIFIIGAVEVVQHKCTKTQLSSVLGRKILNYLNIYV